jgi:hypothetical protein
MNPLLLRWLSLTDEQRWCVIAFAIRELRGDESLSTMIDAVATPEQAEYIRTWRTYLETPAK